MLGRLSIVKVTWKTTSHRLKKREASLDVLRPFTSKAPWTALKTRLELKFSIIIPGVKN